MTSNLSGADMFRLFRTPRKPRPRYVVLRDGKRWSVKRSRLGYHLKHYSGMSGYWPTLNALRAECADQSWTFQRA